MEDAALAVVGEIDDDLGARRQGSARHDRCVDDVVAGVDQPDPDTGLASGSQQPDDIADPPADPPIPDSDGTIRTRELTALGGLPADAVATVRELRSDVPERLVRWKELGLVPGARCKMLERRELEDVMRLDVNGEEFLTGSEGVEGVFVEREA